MSKFQLFPKKKLSQNFLIDHSIRDRIIDVCELKQDDLVVEIGPGKGALTEFIVEAVDNYIGIEKDESLVEFLKEKINVNDHIQLLNADALTFDYETLESKAKLIGNLPYHISSPLLTTFVEQRHYFEQLFIMVQHEFGKRLVAKPKTKDYGSLTCFIQMYMDAKILFVIGSRSFRPAPKVNSCFMRLDVLEKPRYEVKDEAQLFRVIRQAFTQRRKTVANALEAIYPKDRIQLACDSIALSPKSRPDQISLEEYVNLTNALMK